MWNWQNDGYRSDNISVQPIPPEWVQVGNFIFIGKTQPEGAIDTGEILKDFDHLLELYLFVEDTLKTSEEALGFEAALKSPDWKFQAGHTPYARLQTATFTERTLNVELRHNWLQTKIFNALCNQYGENCVGTEQRSISNGEIDFVIEKDGRRVFAELKTSSRALTCIREALGQLLEYAYFGMETPPNELWVLGTGGCTERERGYLEKIRKSFGLNLYYRQFHEEQETLGSPV